MILGISSFAYGWSIGVSGNMPSTPMLETDLVELSSNFELACIQIGDNLPLHNFSDARLLNLKNLTEKHNIRLEIGARMLTRDNLHRYINLAKFFHAPLLRFVVDGSDYEPDANVIVTIIKESVPVLEKENIVLGIENHDRFKAKELASIIDSVDNKQVGICLDCVNSMGAGEGLEHVLEVLSPYTVNLHVKDFTVQRLSHNMGFSITGVPAGRGMVSVPSLLEKLMKYNRCQSAILEQWVSFEKNIEHTVNMEHAWAVESIEYLKTIPVFNVKQKIKNIL